MASLNELTTVFDPEKFLASAGIGRRVVHIKAKGTFLRREARPIACSICAVVVRS